MKISYSTPGKVILSGEHAVVYGKPAIVAAIDIRLQVTLTSAKNSQKNSQLINLIAKTVLQYLKNSHYPLHVRNYYCVVDSKIPIGRGLGSSAALSVAGAAAFLEFFGKKCFPVEIIDQIAFLLEKKFHNNPSGVDNTACRVGGLIYFRREFEFLKSIFQLQFKIPPSIEKALYLIDSGRPAESTSDMVSYVGASLNKNPNKIKAVFEDIEITTKQFVDSIASENSDLFQKTITKNQQLLEQLGVASPSTRRLLTELKPFGVGKITGAGGRKNRSGFLLFYTTKPHQFAEFCKLKKIKYLKFEYATTGLKKIVI